MNVAILPVEQLHQEMLDLDVVVRARQNTTLIRLPELFRVVSFILLRSDVNVVANIPLSWYRTGPQMSVLPNTGLLLHCSFLATLRLKRS